ncbi:hypothetical protein D9758_005640 [Tetrapyrgos nigripes]|uniref:DUF6699 domain-containing protein n=1 Tax=Tetrapyrgos nigripes TaxID=182062 RepID=A0A8H5LPH7_9AGAR|nr:hypothetical protein D9758_005640 [Tetrapyrgos nigripes]
MSAAAAFAGWSNQDSGGHGDLFAAFPGARSGVGQSPFVGLSSPAAFSPFAPRSPGNLFAQHQEYALHNRGAGDWGDGQRFVGWEGPTPGIGPSFFGGANGHGESHQGFSANNGHFGTAGVAEANGNVGGWFGKEGQKKMQHLGYKSTRGSRRHDRGFFDDDDDEEWDEDLKDWERLHHTHGFHDETDWDLLDDLDMLGHGDRRRHRRSGSRSGSRQRRHSFSQIYDHPHTSPYSPSDIPPPSPFYQLSTLSSASFKSPRRSLLNLPLLGTHNDDPFRPRPLSWRADYSARPGLLSKVPLPSLLKSPASSPYGLDGFHDPVKRVLHPYLAFSTSLTNFSLSMDLRMNPRHRVQSRDARRLNGLLVSALGGFAPPIHFLHLPHSSELTKIQLNQPACTPPVDRMRLYHPRLPWYVDVVQIRPGFGGVTVGDVILQLWMSLQTQVTQEEYGAEEMDEHLDSGAERRLKKASLAYGMYSPGFGVGAGIASKRYGVGRSFISRAWSERCLLVGLLEGDEVLTGQERAAGHYGRKEKAEMAEGVRRVDWLGAEGMATWIGLRRSKNGIWEIKTQTLR